MNINAVISQNQMMRSFTASVRKNMTEAEKPSAFEEKLQEFREDNLLDKLAVDPIRQPEEAKPASDKLGITCSSRLFDMFDDNLTAEEALKKLDENLSKIGEYSLDSQLDPREVLQHLAAQHIIYKRHISGVGGQEDIESLDAMVESYTHKYAEGFADTVGAFFEKEGGMEGERDRIYESAVDSVKHITKAYEGFISQNGSKFDALVGDARKNQLSLGNELRKAVHKSGLVVEGKKIELYDSAQLSDAGKLFRFAGRMTLPDATAKKNEEELGIEIGKMMLEARSFLHESLISEKSAHGNAFFTAVRKQSEQYLDKVDELLKGESEDTSFAPLDRDAIYLVVNAMEWDYENYKSISGAVDVGNDLALKQYLSKADVDSRTERYQGSAFWQKVVNQELSDTKTGRGQYRWIQDLLTQKTNSWLNTIA